jgi:hypothetical protein
MTNWQILIENFLGGFSPAWYKETYPSYGNKNQAGTMQNIDLTNAGFMTQGPGLSTLTAGTQAGAVTTLIKGALDFAVTADTTYGVGGSKLYQFTSTTVSNAGIWPHTIDKAAVTAELGEDVAYYQGNLYYSYNHSGSAGDIGKYDLNVTFDDDWGSTVPSGAGALTSTPHQLIVGGNDVMYFSNGIYVGSYDGTTFNRQALDLPVGSVIQSIKWNSDRVWIAANRPNLTGSNKNTASIYAWDGTTNSWEIEIKLMGTVGGMHVKNGVLFVFYQDITSTGGYKLGYVNNGGITDVANYTGALPAFYQITDYKDFILWDSNGLAFAFGAGDKDLPVRLFQIADSGFATVGCVVCPFGTPIIASTESTSYKLAKFSGYDTAANWKSLVFDVTGSGKAKTKTVRINFETLATGARADWKLLDNQGRTLYSDTISYAKAIASPSLHSLTSAVYEINGKVAENYRIEFDFTNGSTANPVKIKNVKIYGSID